MKADADHPLPSVATRELYQRVLICQAFPGETLDGLRHKAAAPYLQALQMLETARQVQQ